MTATIPGVGPQLDRAAAGTDPRGILTFAFLPDDLQKAEDSRAAADYTEATVRRRARGYEREATQAERQLLEHLGYTLPEELVTVVRYRTRGVRHRSWPAIETQEVTP